MCVQGSALERARSLLTWARASKPVRLGLLAVVLACCGYGLAAEWPGVQAALGRMQLVRASRARSPRRWPRPAA